MPSRARSLVFNKPLHVVFISLVPMLLAAIFLPGLEQDVRSDAFLAKDNPALLYKKKIKEQFGLSDPLVIAVAATSPKGIYTPDNLRLIDWLSTGLSSLPGINGTGVVSLATAKNIFTTPEGLEIEHFYESPRLTPDLARQVERSVEEFPVYLGNLVSEDGSVAIVVGEVVEEDQAGEVYHSVMKMLEDAPVPEGISLHVAGEGAIIGYLGEYVDADARRLLPFTGLVIFLILVVACRSVWPALISSVIALATLTTTAGAMSAAGVPFYVITNALPVILVGISVADALHIYCHYFDLQARQPNLSTKGLLEQTLANMWRPVTLTSLTTMAGFLGLAIAAYMPPFRYFGLFAALGVMVAWFYSLFFLPAVILLTKPSASESLLRGLRQESPDLFHRILIGLGAITSRYYRAVVWTGVAIFVASLGAASQLVVDEDPVEVFHSDAPMARADRIINRHLNGSNTLDVVIETPAAEDLFKLENLRKIESLQIYAESLSFVGGSVSIVDYLKQMNKALNDGAVNQYRLPDNEQLVAQYFLLYAASSDPTDFEEEVDYDYQNANIRLYLTSGNYKDIKVVIHSLQTYIDTHLNNGGMSATISGRVAVNYHWIKDLARSHFMGLFMAVALVVAISAILFRSLLAGLYALLPVAGSVLLIYGAMSLTGISLGMGTSMFAAVTVGLGVDFSIHTLDRIRLIYTTSGGDMEKTMEEFYLTTGRALLFNFLAVAGGFAVLTVSKISSLNVFGAVVVLAVATSFFSSVTLLPALLKMFTPGFMKKDIKRRHFSSGSPSLMVALVAMVILSASVCAPDAGAGNQGLDSDKTVESSADSAFENVLSDDEMMETEGPESALMLIDSADQVVSLVNSVSEGDQLTRQIEMLMTDRRGKQRRRETISYRKQYGDQRRTVLYFLEPANIRDTGFLIWDYSDIEEKDDQWLYLPALGKVRRISAGDRGDYFLGTDFTYEDMKLDGKLEPRDYDFSLIEKGPGGVYRLEARPKNDKIAKELGYSRTVFDVDGRNWMVTHAEFWDLNNQPLKTLQASDIRQIDGIWTRHNLVLTNHQTGHETRFIISEVDYLTEVRDEWLTKEALQRGH